MLMLLLNLEKRAFLEQHKYFVSQKRDDKFFLWKMFRLYLQEGSFRRTAQKVYISVHLQWPRMSLYMHALQTTPDPSKGQGENWNKAVISNNLYLDLLF